MFFFSINIAAAQKDADFTFKKTLAELYSQKGNYTQAIENFAIAISIDPSCIECKRAIKELKKKIEEKRKNYRPLANLSGQKATQVSKKINTEFVKESVKSTIKLKLVFPEMVTLKYPYINEDTTINEFSIGKYEVSQKEWKAYCQINNLQFPEIPTNLINENYPIINITWQEAKNYTQWLFSISGEKYDLPTKSEWLLAKNKIENLKNEAWIFENSAKTIHPIGAKKQNSKNLYDIEGNVAEWVDDWAEKDFISEKELKAYFDENDHLKNRVVCGCSYKDESYFCKDNFLRSYDSEIKKDFIGFRLVKRNY